MIKLENVSKTYKNGTHALENVSLHINPQEFVYITGSTGSGKSTIIRLLDGEEIPTKGTVMVDGTNVGKLRHGKVPVYRRKIGVVFQDYRLLPRKTVFENVAYALEVVDMPTKEIRERVREVLKLVDLSHKAAQYPNQLSGGQQQRVAIARAIANRPKILICDEPTGNLDPAMSDEIIKLLEKINEEEKTTILVVTHDSEIIKNHPKRNIILKEGFLQGDIVRTTTLVNENATTAEAEHTAKIETQRLKDLIEEVDRGGSDNEVH